MTRYAVYTAILRSLVLLPLDILSYRVSLVKMSFRRLISKTKKYMKVVIRI